MLGFEDIGASAAKAEYRCTHGFKGDIARHDHEVRPAQFAAVFLFDRPQ